jgi:hypothetical protein
MYTVSDDIARYSKAIKLTRLISRKTLSRLRHTFFFLAVFIFVAAVAVGFIYPGSDTTILYGAALILAALWLEQVLIYCYHNSFFYYGLNSILGIEKEEVTLATYDVADTLIGKEEDVTKSFCTSRLGTVVLLRAGIDLNKVDEYLRSERLKINASMIPLPDNDIFTLIGLGKYLLQQDSTFSSFVKAQGVTEENFLGTLRWVIGSHNNEKRASRWWGKDNLSKTQGIGRQWSYGTAYILEKFSRDIRTSAVYSNITNGDTAFTKEKIGEVEVALARAKASNVLVIGEAGVGKIDLLLEVDRRLRKGEAISSVKDQHMVMLDTSRLFATHKDKQELELTLLAIFSEATRAGNVIIVIENLSSFIREAEALGIFI